MEIALSKEERYKIFKEACSACAHNHRLLRGKERGAWQSNPYEFGTVEYKYWDDAYFYKDMVDE